jgi:hypothetical protein
MSEIPVCQCSFFFIFVGLANYLLVSGGAMEQGAADTEIVNLMGSDVM